MSTETSTNAEVLMAPAQMSQLGRWLVLITAFLGWLFAGLEMSNFNLTTSPMVQEFLGTSLAEKDLGVAIGKWFGWFICAMLLGAAIGGLLFGWLGDGIGRSRAMGLSILWYALGMGVCYFATSLEQLLALRFVASLGIGGMWPNGVALTSEAWTNASRPLLAGLIGTAANVGIALMGYLGEVRPITNDDWRWVLVISGLPVFLGLFVLGCVPESPRWLACRASKSLATQPSATPVSLVFRPPYLRPTLIGILLGTIPLLGGWGSATWLIAWADKVGVATGDPSLNATTQWIGSIGAALGSLLGGWLAELLGRRATYFVISLGSVLSSGYIFWSLTPADGSFLAWVFVLRLISTVYFGWLPLYLPELFPTEIRSTGSGVAFNFGRILTAVGVLGTSALVQVCAGDFAQVGRITHLVFGLGMVVILFAPDTSQKSMED